MDEPRGEACLRCGLCEVHCPALGARAGFPGPRAVGPDARRFRGTGPPRPEPALGGCLGCGTCERVCPQGLGPWRLGRLAKEALVAVRGLAPAEAVLSRGPSLGPLGSLLSPLSNLGLRTPPARLGERLLGLDPDFPFPGWARKPLRRLAAKEGLGGLPTEGVRAAGRPGPRPEAVLFAGCFAEYNDPAPGLAALRLLRAIGLPTLSAPPVCCGLPALAKGDRVRAARLVEAALRRLSPVLELSDGPLLVVSPSCLWMIRENWPLLVPGRDSETAAARAADALSRILAGNLPALAPLGRLLAYQAPCHLRLARGGLPALKLPDLIPGLEIRDLDRGCCGQGGTYAMEAAGAPVAEAASRLIGAALGERPYDGVVSECEACRMRLALASGLPTWHPLEILTMALGTAPARP